MQLDDNEALARRWAAAVASGDERAFAELLAPDVADISAAVPVAGTEPFLARSRAVHAAFGAVSVSVDELVSAGAALAWRFTLRGEHRAPFLGVAATGRPIAVSGVNFQLVEAGRVRRHFTLLDRLALLEQLRGPLTRA